MKIKPLSWVCASIIIIVLSSCGASLKNHQQRVLLQGIDTAKDLSISFPDQKIKKGDLLTILINSDNKEATEIYNQSMGTSGTSGAGGATNLLAMGRGYQVDQNGQIFVHSLGLITAEGKTKSDLAAEIRKGLEIFLKQPYVTIRFANQRITVIGEVMRPGVIEMPDQKLSILDAIGFAGDLTQFGRRDNVLIMREVNGKREAGRIDLRTSDFYSSPYFYLQQNDLVYVEPTRKKPTGNEQVLSRNLTILTSVVSVAALVITLITR